MRKWVQSKTEVQMKKKLIATALLGAMGLGSIGCETKAGTGALVGGAGGAAAGGLIGSMSHGRAGEGALIGGAVGAIGGALIGNGMDKNDAKKRREDVTPYRERETQAPAVAGRVAKSDVMEWSRNGTKEDVIVDRIERSGAMRLSSADERELKDAGVSDRVIRAMRGSARG
jgi:uncharacterized protein YcfJ